MARQSLGRGIDSLIPKDLDKTILEEDQHRIQRLLITDVSPSTNQPRGEFDETALGELISSVKRHGVLQPIIVVRNGSKFTIVAGERRWRAAQAAGLTRIPAIVRSLQELEKIELSLIENIQRVDLSPLEQALSLYKLQHQFNLALDEIAQKLGKAPSTISNLIRLLQLPNSARVALSGAKISEGHARAILALKNFPQLQEKLLENILSGGWTVRQAEQFVKDARGGEARKTFDQLTPQQSGFAAKMSDRLGAPVEIKRSSRGGKVIIKFKSDAELQKIADQLGG